MRRLERVKEHQNYSRVDGSYIINTDAKGYQDALKRRQRVKSLLTMEEKIAQLQEKLRNLEEGPSDDNK